MKNLSINEINQEIERLTQQKRLKIRQEREAKKKRKQKLCYVVGELFIKYFPDIQNINSGTKNEIAENLASFEKFLKLIASDETTTGLLKDSLPCKQDNVSNV